MAYERTISFRHKKGIVLVGNMAAVEVEKNTRYVKALVCSGTPIILGHYATEKRAEEVLLELNEWLSGKGSPYCFHMPQS